MSINVIEKQADNNPIGTTVELASSASVVGDYVKADGKAKDATLFPALSSAVEGGVNLGKKKDVIDFLFGKIRRAASFDDRSYFISSTGIFQSVSGKITPIIEFDTECLFGHIHLNEGYLFASNGTIGKLYYKTANADDFTVVDLPETNVQQSVCRDTTNNRFVAISKTSIYTSTDLLTWTKQKDLTTQYGSYNRGIVELGGDFYTDYNDYTGTINKIPGDFVTAEASITVGGYYSALVKHNGQVFFTADVGTTTAYIYYTNDFVTINSLSFAKNTYPGTENMATGAPAFDSSGNVIAVYGDVFYAYDLVNSVQVSSSTITTSSRNTVILIGGDGSQADLRVGCVSVDLSDSVREAFSFYEQALSKFKRTQYFLSAVEIDDFVFFICYATSLGNSGNSLSILRYNKSTKEVNLNASPNNISSTLNLPAFFNINKSTYRFMIKDTASSVFRFFDYDFLSGKNLQEGTWSSDTTTVDLVAYETSKYAYVIKSGYIQFFDKSDKTFPPPDIGFNLTNVNSILIDDMENVYVYGYNQSTTTNEFNRLIGDAKTKLSTPQYTNDGVNYSNISSSILIKFKNDFIYTLSSYLYKSENGSLFKFGLVDNGHRINYTIPYTRFIKTKDILFVFDQNRIHFSFDGTTLFEFEEVSLSTSTNTAEIPTDVVETDVGIFVFQTGIKPSCILELGGDGEFYPPKIQASRPNHNVYIKAK